MVNSEARVLQGVRPDFDLKKTAILKLVLPTITYQWAHIGLEFHPVGLVNLI